MLACKHFAFHGLKTYIKMSENPWNAWVEAYNSNNNLYHSTFETGLFWEYLEHLSKSRECREEVGVSEEEVSETLKMIEREWESQNFQGLDDFEYSITFNFSVYPAAEVPGHRKIEDGVSMFSTLDRQVASDVAKIVDGRVICTMYNNTVFLLVTAADKCILVSQIDKRDLLSQVKKLSI